MSSLLDSLSPVEIGERLRVARESANVTQADAAKAANVARTTVVAIEQGQRQVRIDEIRLLVEKYGTSLNRILRNEAVHVDLIPRFRKLSGRPQSQKDETEKAVKILNTFVSAELELENVLCINKHDAALPQERVLRKGDVRIQAEQDAKEIRNWLGLGDNPVANLLSILEFQLGVRIYLYELDAEISGLFSYDKRAGACMLLNSKHSYERIVLTAAHELGHLVATRQKPDVFREHGDIKTREDRYADEFSFSFLMPKSTLASKFFEITAGASTLTRRHIILLSSMFSVSREAMVRMLEQIGLAPKGSWEWFKSNGGITKDHVSQVLGRTTCDNTEKEKRLLPISQRLYLLIANAYHQDLYSEGQLASMLGFGRREIRTILDLIEDDESGADEAIKLSR